MRDTRLGTAALIGYAGTILAANWSIGHIGTCSGQGPCVLPVGGGLYAPSGVLFVGLALFLRDLVQDHLGRRWTLAGILAGAVLSWWVEAPALALASATAFLLSEAADFCVYQPLRERHHVAAVWWSGVVGSVVDSAVFLGLAFHSLAFLPGQVLGKWEMTALCALVAWLWQFRRGERREVAPSCI